LGLISRWDLFEIIPDWKFFAPNPLTCDYYLFARTMNDYRHWGDWYHVPVWNDRPWYSALWNPGKRKFKLLVDLVSCLEAYRQLGDSDSSDTSLQITLPYISLLDYASQAASTTAVTHVQFMIARKTGMSAVAEVKPLFVSFIHTMG
jgi:hypothetical protein